MTVIRRVFRQTFFLASSNVFSRGVSFLTTILIVRALTPFDYGVMTMALTLIGPLLMGIHLGLDELVVAEVVRARAEGRSGYARAIYQALLRYRLVAWGLVMVTVWYFQNNLARTYGPLVREATLPLLLLVTAHVLKAIMHSGLRIIRRFDVVAWQQGVETLLRLILVVGVLAIHRLDAPAVIGLTFASMCVSLPLGFRALLPLVREFLTAPIDPHPGLWRLVRERGLWQSVLSLGSDAIAAIRNIIIIRFLPPEAIALWAVAQSTLSAVSSVFPARHVLLSEVAHIADRKQELQHMLSRYARYGLVVNTVLLLAVWLGAAVIFPQAFPSYGVSGLLIVVFAFRLPLAVVTGAQTVVMTVFGRQRFLFLHSLAVDVVSLLCLPFFLQRFGIAGIGWELLLSTAGYAVREWYIRRALGLSVIGGDVFAPPRRQELRSFLPFLRTMFRIDGKRKPVV